MIADVALGTITDEARRFASETRSSVGAESRRRDAAVLSIAKVCGLVFTIETLINSGNRGSIAVAEEVLNTRWRKGRRMEKGCDERDVHTCAAGWRDVCGKDERDVRDAQCR